MPILSQFALSLELSRLVPLQLIGNSTQKAILLLARQLRNSGSDIIIEQDLAQLFGRSRVAQQMESTFRALVSKSSNVPLTNEIHIANGAGPTTIRAFQERPHFTTLVQLSLLVWVHDTYSLAQVLADVLETRFEQAPEEYLSPPDPKGIAGTLSTIEEQTATFDWGKYLHAIGAMLELGPPSEVDDPVNINILHSLLDMLPLVQTLPLERMIHVESDSGFCTMVAWSHHALGLTVRVKTLAGKQVTFGSGPEQVYIECSEKASSISLYDSSGPSNEILFRNSSDLQVQLIEATYRTRLRGYGKASLLSSGDDVSISLSPAQLKDMVSITVAFCRLVHTSLKSKNGRFVYLKPNVGAERRILEVANILFDSEVNEISVLSYFNSYQSRPLDSNLDLPASFSLIPQEKLRQPISDVWGSLIRNMQALAGLLLCLAYVDRLSDCEQFRLPGMASFNFHNLIVAIDAWDGRSPITITEGTIFEFMCVLIDQDFENNRETSRRNVSMLSRHGWTLYLPSFSDEDPTAVEIEKVKLISGVPYRNEVRISCLIDAQLNSRVDCPPAAAIQVAIPGDVLHPPYSQFQVRRGKTMFSQQLNSQAATFLFEAKIDGLDHNFRRAAYRSLHRSLWNSRPCRTCSHSMLSCKDFKLPSDCGAFIGLPAEAGEGFDPDGESRGVRIAIYLTEKSVQARWSALTGYVDTFNDLGRDGLFPKYILRSNSCCLSCAVSQAASSPGRWRVIL